MDTEIEFLKSEIKRLRDALNRLTPPLSVMIRRRGFKIYKKEPADDLFLPDEEFIDSYYEMLKKYSFRLFLRDVIKYQPFFTLTQVSRYATKEVASKYIDFLIAIRLISMQNNSYMLTKGRIRSFGETLEWFVSEIFKREFFIETLRGVKMKKRSVGGDYDLLAKIDGSILYMEIKSSPPKQIYINETGAFLERVADLMPEIAIFFVDTELRMKDKIVPMFEDESRMRLKLPLIPKRLEKEIFEMTGNLKEPSRIFIINAKDSIIKNIETVLSAFFRGGVV